MGSVGDRISNIRDGRTKSKPLLEKNARGSQSRTNPILDVGEQDEDITRGGTMDGMCWLSGWMRRTTWGGGDSRHFKHVNKGWKGMLAYEM